MSLEQTINQDIKAAMIAKDNTALRGLRAIKAAILLAKTEKTQVAELSKETEIKILQKLAKQRRESADIYKSQNRADLLQTEMEELAIIEAYLPPQLDRKAIEKAVSDIISKTGATSIKDIGKTIGLANQKLAGQADGKTISEIVKNLLS